MSLNPKLLESLACPITKTPLVYDKENQKLISVEANLAFLIKNDIPLIIINEAEKITDSKTKKVF